MELRIPDCGQRVGALALSDGRPGQNGYCDECKQEGLRHTVRGEKIGSPHSHDLQSAPSLNRRDDCIPAPDAICR
jgi:hypothetical protein